MPEGPELRIMADFINKVSQDRVYQKITKSKVAKTIPLGPNYFTLRAESRGKELRLICQEKHLETPHILLCRMGMSAVGSFVRKVKNLNILIYFFIVVIISWGIMMLDNLGIISGVILGVKKGVQIL